MWSTKSLDVLLADSLCAKCGLGAGGRAGYKSNIYSNRNIMNISCWDAVEEGPDSQTDTFVVCIGDSG